MTKKKPTQVRFKSSIARWQRELGAYQVLKEIRGRKDAGHYAELSTIEKVVVSEAHRHFIQFAENAAQRAATTRYINETFATKGRRDRFWINVIRLLGSNKEEAKRWPATSPVGKAVAKVSHVYRGNENYLNDEEHWDDPDYLAKHRDHYQPKGGKPTVILVLDREDQNITAPETERRGQVLTGGIVPLIRRAAAAMLNGVLDKPALDALAQYAAYSNILIEKFGSNRYFSDRFEHWSSQLKLVNGD